jgi:hypothetical protein
MKDGCCAQLPLCIVLNLRIIKGKGEEKVYGLALKTGDQLSTTAHK